MRFLLCVGFKATFRLHLPVVLSAAFITSLLIQVCVTAVMFINVVPRLLQAERDLVSFIPKMLQTLDERHQLLGAEAISTTRASLTTVMQIASHDMFIPVGIGAGACVALLLAIHGMLNTLKVYSHTYELLWRAGPSALRYPLRRANSIRFFATFVAFQLCGMVLVVIGFVVLAVLLLLLWEDEWFGAPKLRGFLVALVGLQLTEMLIVRTVLVPFFQKLRCGPALFMCELWYLNSGFVKGFTRLLLLWFILLSFFTPARCTFIDGMEAWDSGHLTFVCYVMTRVERDKQLVKEKQAAARKAHREWLEQLGGSLKRGPNAIAKPASCTHTLGITIGRLPLARRQLLSQDEPFWVGPEDEFGVARRWNENVRRKEALWAGYVDGVRQIGEGAEFARRCRALMSATSLSRLRPSKAKRTTSGIRRTSTC